MNKKEKNDLMSIWVERILICMFIILSITGLVIVSSTIYASILVSKGVEKAVDISLGMNYIQITLSCIALCIALAVCIPYVMSRAITSKDIEEAVREQMHKSMTDQKLEKVDADHSRITSVLLEHIGKPIWSIGWNTRSLIRYLRCDGEVQQDMYWSLSATCIPRLVRSIRSFIKVTEKGLGTANREELGNKKLRNAISKVFNADAVDEENDYLIIRTLTDIIDYRIENEKSKKDPCRGRFTNIIESPEQIIIIDSFIHLTIGMLGSNVYPKCQKSTWHTETEFSAKFNSYIPPSDKTLVDLYRNLQAVAKENPAPF